MTSRPFSLASLLVVAATTTLLWLRPSAWINDVESNRLARLALATVPDNALLCAGIIDANWRIFATIPPSLDAGRARFRHNTAYAWAGTWRH